MSLQTHPPGYSAEDRTAVVKKDIPYTPWSHSKLNRLWFSPHLTSPFLRKYKLDRLDFKPAERKPGRHRLVRQSLSAFLAARPLQCERLQPRIVLEQVRLVRRDNLTHINLQADGSVAPKAP
jgi:hypothetical protein